MKTVNSEHTFSKELLQHLHILTQDGKINQDSNRKLKQILHLNQFIIPLLKKIEDHDFTLIDVGAGKSYLGFLLYDQYIKHLSHGKVIGIEAREDLIQKSVELAQKLSFSRMHFIGKTIEEILLDRKILQADIVTALHACNTATDEAIRLGIQKNARSIVLIPCCQAEVAATLKEQKRHFTKDPFLQLFRHPLHNREFGSHLTNILRCLCLEAHGYQVTVTEFVGLEHSMKNELIIAQFIDQKNHQSEKDLIKLIEQFKLEKLQHRFMLT